MDIFKLLANILIIINSILSDTLYKSLGGTEEIRKSAFKITKDQHLSDLPGSSKECQAQNPSKIGIFRI